MHPDPVDEKEKEPPDWYLAGMMSVRLIGQQNVQPGGWSIFPDLLHNNIGVSMSPGFSQVSLNSESNCGLVRLARRPSQMRGHSLYYYKFAWIIFDFWTTDSYAVGKIIAIRNVCFASGVTALFLE
jgi:hypothetical protein